MFLAPVSARLFQNFSKEYPKLSDFDYQKVVYTFVLPGYLADFLGDEGVSKVALCYAFRAKDVGYVEKEKQKKATLQRAIFFHTPKWEEKFAQRDTISFKIPKEYCDYEKENHYVLTWLSILPGKYEYGIELKDLKSHKLAQQQFDVEIEKYSFQYLQISDLLIGWHNEKSEWPTPNASKIFLSGKPTTIYYEIYNFHCPSLTHS